MFWEGNGMKLKYGPNNIIKIYDNEQLYSRNLMAGVNGGIIEIKVKEAVHKYYLTQDYQESGGARELTFERVIFISKTREELQAEEAVKKAKESLKAAEDTLKAVKEKK